MMLVQRRHLNALSDIKMSSILFNPRQIFILFVYHAQGRILIRQGYVDILPYRHVFGLDLKV
jgi:hypothetical protein